jgi:hypothetical protein
MNRAATPCSREDEAQRFLAYRIRMVPQQLDAARRKVAALEREAARYGMHDFLPRAAESVR